jgi:UDP-N-acetylmuramoyl-L-alanyl-D-glutamate--2,6-diaminopimelate ligase
VAVITNITHEHLDYHGTFEAYRDAKARIFKDLEQTAPKPFYHASLPVGILNADDASYEFLSSVTSVRKVAYGTKPQAIVRPEHINAHGEGLDFEAVGEGYRIPVKCRLIGEHNVVNCLAAIATTVEGLGVEPEIAGEGIRAIKDIPGRMEKIEMGQDFIAIVDFAHTPNALRCSLQAARGLTSGRVIALFGSAGLRDRAKRRMMAEVSVQQADFTILTAEDPRIEPLDKILEEMAEGAVKAGGVEGISFWRVPDRGEAIRFALSLAKPGDVVIACGKGHEQSMCFGEVEYPWDDRVAMRAALAELLRVPGPTMPYLPTQG